MNFLTDYLQLSDIQKYVSDDSDGSDEDCEPIPKLNIDEIGFDKFIDQGDELVRFYCVTAN